MKQLPLIWTEPVSRLRLIVFVAALACAAISLPLLTFDPLFGNPVMQFMAQLEGSRLFVSWMTFAGLFSVLVSELVSMVLRSDRYLSHFAICVISYVSTLMFLALFYFIALYLMIEPSHGMDQF